MPCIEHTQSGNTGGYVTTKRNGKTQYALKQRTWKEN